jgi:thiol-disulfide isomerase/thioredoxin
MKKLCLGVLVLLAPLVARAEDKIELKVVKFDGLEKAIAAAKGKVVVIDFWATFCAPCKKEFPNLVNLHKQYGPDKIACISVTVDDNEPKPKAAALKFLKAREATFTNLLLDEPAEDWQKKFGAGAVPIVMVYGRDGKLVQKFTADEKEFSYKDVFKVLESLGLK